MKRKFYLDRQNGKFMGVCAGIANYFNIDPTIVRIGAVVVTVLGGFPWTVIAYVAAAWLAKPQPLGFEHGHSPRLSTKDVRENMRDIDRRLAEVDMYVASSDSRLAREIEELR
jgi:phage shock protein C